MKPYHRTFRLALAVSSLSLLLLAPPSLAQTQPAEPGTPPLPAYIQNPTPPTPRTPPTLRPLPSRPVVRPTPPVRRTPTPTAPTTTPAKPFPLVFNGDLLETQTEPGATNALFTFSFTNTSPESVTLTKVQTSCGCTAAQLPQLPWTIASNEAGSFTVSMDIRGKRQAVAKKLFLYSDQGYKSLTVRANVIVSNEPDPDRLRNMQIAATDRQAVFRGDCARCHATPAEGKMGRELFQAVCAVCHLAEHRAEMVPDLRMLRPLPDAEGWRNWIAHGKAGTLMPAFAKEEGGPLTKEQIDSIVDWLAPAKRITPAPPSIP